MAERVSPDVRDLSFGRVADHVGIRFELFDPQQPIIVRRLMLGRNAEPLIIRIKFVGHGSASSRCETTALPARRITVV